MIKHYNATFDYLGTAITISASINDKIEPRDYFKPTLASNLMTRRLREYGIFNIRCIYARTLNEVAKKDTVKWADTVQQLREAEQRFAEMEESTTKLVMKMFAVRDAVPRR